MQSLRNSRNDLGNLNKRIFERKKAELKSTIDYKNRQLTSYTIDLND